jgi:8-oxo-dGTP pyrophosphatase MutT (NUDIX family)
MLEPQPAATVMIARENLGDIEIFMLRRSSRSTFMPDVFVFPGGRVEAQDATPRARERMTGSTPPPDASVVFAAVRETFEECGLLFATRALDAARLDGERERVLAGTLTFTEMLHELNTRVDAGALRYFSRWITPPVETRRFDTSFFVARAPKGQAARADACETHDGLWITPRDALARCAQGAFALIFPTIKHLERLSAFNSIDALLAYAANKPIQAVTPSAEAGRAFAIPPALEGVW